MNFSSVFIQSFMMFSSRVAQLLGQCWITLHQSKDWTRKFSFCLQKAKACLHSSNHKKKKKKKNYSHTDILCVCNPPRGKYGCFCCQNTCWLKQQKKITFYPHNIYKEKEKLNFRCMPLSAMSRHLLLCCSCECTSLLYNPSNFPSVPSLFATQSQDKCMI